MKKKFVLSLLLATMLLMSMAVVPAVSAQEVIEQKLTFGPETLEELKNDPNFIAAYGNIPTFESLEEREKWLDTLDKIYTEVNDNFEKEMSKYFYPNGPVIAYGYTIDGVLKVAIEKGQKIDAAKENELYDLFSNYGQNIAVKDVPLIIVYEDLPTPTSRTSSWRPIIGGIKICTEKPDGIKKSTLGYSAQTSSGTKGYVVAGHTAPSIGDQIWQPTAGPSANKVGTVSKVGGHYADASWVPYSNVAAKIYDTDTDVLKDVKSHENAAIGDTVYKSGITTGRSYGSVTEIRTSYDNPLGTLYRQYVAGYNCDGGDSGAPVYVYVSGGVKIVGIHWGGVGTYNSGYSTSIFSPVSGVQSDLGVTPLTA
ncbi:hypothetical protein DSECCO2_575600 [anaerobic digester metagenome]